MTERTTDGSAGDTDYEVVGHAYAAYRRPEPAIAQCILGALGAAQTVLNVGAGTSSYEPPDRRVTAVEPSAAMRARRPADRAAAIDAVAENLPFPDGHFDASMTTFSVHQWMRLDDGLREMRRVTRGPVVVLTCDPDRVHRFWLNDYAPDVLAAEARRYPSFSRIAAALGGDVTSQPVPVPLLCRDGFNEAYYGRPERFLDPAARSACSAWSFVNETTVDRCLGHLRGALATGAWDREHGHLRTQATFEGSLRLLVSRPRLA